MSSADTTPVSTSPTLSTGPTARRVLQFARRHWRMALLQVSLAITGTLLMPVFPSVTQWFFDDIIPNKRYDQITHAALLMFGAFFAIELLFYFRTRVNSAFEQIMVFDLRGQLHRKISHMSLNWFDKQSTGDIFTRMADDVPATQRVVLEGIEQGLTAILQIIMALVVMFNTHVALTWVVLIPTPLIAAGGWIYAKLLAPRELQARAATSAMHGMLFDTLAGIRQIKSYVFEEPQQERFNHTSRHLQGIQKKLMAAAALYSPLMTLLGKMGLVLVMLVGAQWCIHPQEHPLTPGQLLAFVLLVNMLYEPIARLHGVNQMMVSGLASAQRVFAVLDQSGEEDLQHGIAVERLQGAIEFREVAFAYQPQRPIVQSLSISIKPFQTVAFVGATGSGKSTIFQLITGFYTANSGSITIDEHPIEQLAKAALRNNIAYVTQDAFLFATDIRQNLLLGKPGASDEELWHALKLACADEFVARLPDGLNSQVGERGNRLSGGERQRLTMARAFLKNAPILLLDEATSAVDNKSEHLIQQALDALKQNRTCLVIAHRLSTILDADCIYVLRQGEVVAKGTHEELLASSPYYAELAALAFDSGAK
ncbi:MAG TPA: ABC transporter ATP-binding protein [Cellvibrionaceae bacterium]|nr:ABC transporter ATP-binding protein [Cellvibrionaceae bacterium]